MRAGPAAIRSVACASKRGSSTGDRQAVKVCRFFCGQSGRSVYLCILESGRQHHRVWTLLISISKNRKGKATSVRMPTVWASSLRCRLPRKRSCARSGSGIGKSWRSLTAREVMAERPGISGFCWLHRWRRVFPAGCANGCSGTTAGGRRCSWRTIPIRVWRSVPRLRSSMPILPIRTGCDPIRNSSLPTS